MNVSKLQNIDVRKYPDADSLVIKTLFARPIVSPELGPQNFFLVRTMLTIFANYVSHPDGDIENDLVLNN